MAISSRLAWRRHSGLRRTTQPELVPGGLARFSKGRQRQSCSRWYRRLGATDLTSKNQNWSALIQQLTCEGSLNPIFRVIGCRLSKRQQPGRSIVRTRRASTSMDAARATALPSRRSFRDTRLDRQPGAHRLVQRHRRGAAQAAEICGIEASLIHNEPEGRRLGQPTPVSYDYASG